MWLDLPYPTINKADYGNTFQLSPATLTIHSPQPSKIADAAIEGKARYQAHGGGQEAQAAEGDGAEDRDSASERRGKRGGGRGAGRGGPRGARPVVSREGGPEVEVVRKPQLGGGDGEPAAPAEEKPEA